MDKETSQKKITKLKDELRLQWEQHLKDSGVKFPKGKRLNALLCLFAHMPNPISQQEMIDWHSEMNLPEYDRQARHLVRDGWDLRSGNTRFTGGEFDGSMNRDQLRLHSTSSPSPAWKEDAQRRVGVLTDDEWDAILEKFKERGCAVCGRKMRHYDKGHLCRDIGYTVHNIVPMCVECNNWGQEVEFKMERGLVARPLLKYFVKRGVVDNEEACE